VHSKKLSARQKRLLIGSLFRSLVRPVIGSGTPYWKVCHEQEDFKCTAHIADENDHSMKHYLASVNDSSAEMYTKRNTRKSSFEQAFIGTCRNQKKRSIL